MNLVKQAKFAEMCGVSRQTVLRWRTAGSLVMQGNLVDVEATHERMQRFHAGGSPLKNCGVTEEVTAPDLSPESVTQSDKSPVATRHRREGGRRPEASGGDANATARAILPGESPEEAAIRLVAALNPDMDFDEARRVEMNYRALKAQLEYDRDSGIVVLVADVAKAVGNEYAKTRTKLLSIPTSLAPQLLQLKTAPQMCAALERAITEALEELSADATGN